MERTRTRSFSSRRKILKRCSKISNPARCRGGGRLASAFDSSASREAEDLWGLNLQAAQLLLEKTRDVRHLVCRGCVNLIQDEEKLGHLLFHVSNEVGLNFSNRGIYRKHHNSGIYLFEIALGSASVVGVRRTDAWGIDKNDSALKEGRRVSKLDRRDLSVPRIAGFRNVVCQTSEIDLLPRPCAVKDIASGVGPYLISVMTAVTGRTPVGKISAPIRALIKELFPRFI